MNEHIDISTLLVLRKVTRAISEFLGTQLSAYLQALTPQFNPRPVLGERVRGGSKTAGRNGEKAFEELTGLYQSVFRTKPFNLRKDFDTPVDVLSATPEITSSTYSYLANDGNDSKSITVTSPLTWVLTYKGFSPERLRELLARQSGAVGSDLQQCVLHYLVMRTTLDHRRGASRLLEALRFPVSIEYADEFGKLPLPVISCPLSTSRPTDEVIIESTELTGTSEFEEVINLGDIAQMSDPLKDKIVELAQSKGGDAIAELVS